MDSHLLIFGYGYTGAAVAALACASGWRVTATQRTPRPAAPGITLIPFDNAAGAIANATHILATAAPDDAGDPVLARYADALRAAQHLRWLCYLSTTGVYGDRAGAWVDETTPPAPNAPRSRRRRAAEIEWERLADRRAVEIFRLAGIYGPGRSAFDDLRAGAARRIIAPHHLFGRIHRDDIAGAILAATVRTEPGLRILNGADNEPAASADVIEEAARLIGLPPPPAIPLADAWPRMSEMARSFWSENRRVASRQTQTTLNRAWTYPSYREGLRGVLGAEEESKAGGFAPSTPIGVRGPQTP